MTNKIYEYRDDQDWYVGVWDVYGGIYILSKIRLSFGFMDLARIFRDEENGFPITITVMRWSSNYRLLSPLSLRFFKCGSIVTWKSSNVREPYLG